MYLNFALTVLGIISAVIVAYHIAFRQGAFKFVNLSFYPALTSVQLPRKKDYANSWVLVNSCRLPETSSGNKLLIHLPLTLENRGKLAAENVIVTLSYDSCYSTGYLGNEVIYSPNGSNISLIKRQHHEEPLNQCHTVFEIPMLPAKSIVSFFDILTYHPYFLTQAVTKLEKKVALKHKQIAIVKISYQILCKNSSMNAMGSFFMVSTSIDDMHIFIDKHQDQLSDVFEQYDPNFKKIKEKPRWLPYPQEFFAGLLYGNMGLNYNLVFRTIGGYCFMEDREKKPHVAEAFELSTVDWGVVRIPFTLL
jgi:hypothetical protein